MSRTKISNLVKNVSSPYEKERHVKSLKNCKFSLHIYEITEPVQRKKWMALQTRYVDEGSIDVWTEPLSLLLHDVTDTPGEGLFKEIQQYMIEFQIPFANILALSTHNTAVMVGTKN